MDFKSRAYDVINQTLTLSVKTSPNAHFADLFASHGPGDVLLVREHKEGCSGEPLQKGLDAMGAKIPVRVWRRHLTYIFGQQTVEFFLTILHSKAIPRVYDPDNGICLLKIVSPVRPEHPLPTNVPYKGGDRGLGGLA